MNHMTVKEWFRYDYAVKPYNLNETGVSCVCLTYGRPTLLEESIESFLRQDWNGPKELIVVNDHPDQQLKFDHPEVTIFNIPRRLKTLGEKRNFSIALARWDNLLIWDDDDIYLPWRITETMKTLPTAQFFKCPNAWVAFPKYHNTEGRILATYHFGIGPVVLCVSMGTRPLPCNRP
jgi:glycosyltransferase involved in cell wall biosynthesis